MDLELCFEGESITDPGILCEKMANFFIEKANKLASRTSVDATSDNSTVHVTPNMFLITEKMLEDAVSSLKRKKSYGIDETPLCVVKDTFVYLKGFYLKLMRLSTKQIPKMWKTARVLPLFKKGDKKSPDNYRPISNLCSMDKLFQKIVLNEIDRRHMGLEGNHQHGFRGLHSTNTAMLEIQHVIAEQLDQRNIALLYSIDLSAAFDLLNRNVFYQSLQHELDPDLMDVLLDFLSDRKLVVEVNGKQSIRKDVRLGCVQGSVLGPKLFNLYMRKVTDHVDGYHLVSYADDTYVLVTGPTVFDIVKNAEDCIDRHTKYLKDMGMITNLSKTEAVIFTRDKEPIKVPISVGGEVFHTSETMKVLGVHFDYRLSWTTQVDKVIEKGKRLNSGLKFTQRKLSQEQFLKVLTSQYYGSCFYGCAVWMADNSFYDLRRLNALHYRALRIVVKDYKRTTSKSTLDLLGRARPSTWAKFNTSTLVLKITTRNQPKRLCEYVLMNSFLERRKPLRLKFFNKADLRIGRQTLTNRCDLLINDLDFDWFYATSDDYIRVNLKKHYNMNRMV